MAIRKGLGKGTGKGYKNIIPNHDKRVHTQSRMGIKQPQFKNMNIPNINPPKKDPYTITVDDGKPYEIKVNSKAELMSKLKELKEQYRANPDEYPYFDVFVDNKDGKDVTDKVFKEYNKD